MRVCFVADVGVKISGGHQSLLNLITNLEQFDVESFLVSHENWELIETAKKIGIKTKVIPGKIYIYYKNKNLSQFIKYPIKRLYNYMHLKEIKKYLVENKIDLVHLNSVLSSECWARAAYECKIPYVWHIREFMDIDHGRAIIHSSYTYKWMRKANNVITISKAVQIHWENILKRRCSLVYNGLSFQKYGGNSTEKFTADAIRCVIVGRIVEGKGQMDAVKAIEHLIRNGKKYFHLTIVGYRGIDKYELALAEYIKKHDCEKYITLMDYTYDLKSVLDKNDVGLTCSKAEAFGRVTIENMMSGMLAIGTNSGGTPELIDEGKTGFLYDPGDYQKLAELLLMVAENRNKMREIASKGQAKAEECFSIERTAESIYKIYSEII